MGLREEEVIGMVRHAFARDPKLDAPKITISMIEGQVALSGVLDTPEQVQRAEAVVQQLLPTIKVDNSLTVGHDHGRQGAAVAASDTQTVEQELRQALGRAGLPMDDLTIQVTAGRVSLSGQVLSINQKRRVLELATRQLGANFRLDDRISVAGLRT